MAYFFCYFQNFKCIFGDIQLYSKKKKPEEYQCYGLWYIMYIVTKDVKN